MFRVSNYLDKLLKELNLARPKDISSFFELCLWLPASPFLWKRLGSHIIHSEENYRTHLVVKSKANTYAQKLTSLNLFGH